MDMEMRKIWELDLPCMNERSRIKMTFLFDTLHFPVSRLGLR